MDYLAVDVLTGEKMNALVRALQLHRDALVHASLRLNYLRSDTEFEHWQKWPGSAARQSR